jgi:hypothetical protein
VLAWLAAVEEDFVTSLRCREPFSLLILMYWGALLSELDEQRWWARDSGRALVSELLEALSSDDPSVEHAFTWIRRRPSRRLLESLGKVYSAGTLKTSPARQVDPATFHEAVAGLDLLERWAAIQKEYASLLEHGTWEKVRREDVLAGDHVIGCKWIFKTKANGTRKA